jgi:nitrogen regulatory protein P-II 1
MKKIEAIIRGSRVEEVKTALHAIGVHGLTVCEVKGFERQRGHKEVYRGSEYEVDFVPKTELEILASDELAPKIVEMIVAAARTEKFSLLP